MKKAKQKSKRQSELYSVAVGSLEAKAQAKKVISRSVQ